MNINGKNNGNSGSLIRKCKNKIKINIDDNYQHENSLEISNISNHDPSTHNNNNNIKNENK